MPVNCIKNICLFKERATSAIAADRKNSRSFFLNTASRDNHYYFYLHNYCQFNTFSSFITVYLLTSAYLSKLSATNIALTVGAIEAIPNTSFRSAQGLGEG
jgi:hypothetical protein